MKGCSEKDKLGSTKLQAAAWKQIYPQAATLGLRNKPRHKRAMQETREEVTSWNGGEGVLCPENKANRF